MDAACEPCRHFHLLRFPQWQGSTAPAHLAGGHAAAAVVARQLGMSSPAVSVSDVPVEAQTDAHGDEGDDASGVHHLQAIVRQAAAAQELLQGLEAPARIFTIGGDCGVEVAPVSYTNANWPGLGIVWFDAHADHNSPSSSPSGHFHGMPVRTLLGDGPAGIDPFPPRLAPSQIVFVGTRDVDPPEKEYMETHAMRLLPPAPASVLVPHLISALRGFSAAYIHVDLDVLDPSVFPCTCCPTADGLLLPTLIECIGAVKRTVPLVVGVGLTECCGDPSNHETQLAAVVDALAASLDE